MARLGLVLLALSKSVFSEEKDPPSFEIIDEAPINYWNILTVPLKDRARLFPYFFNVSLDDYEARSREIIHVDKTGKPLWTLEFIRPESLDANWSEKEDESPKIKPYLAFFSDYSSQPWKRMPLEAALVKSKLSSIENVIITKTGKEKYLQAKKEYEKGHLEVFQIQSDPAGATTITQLICFISDYKNEVWFRVLDPK